MGSNPVVDHVSCVATAVALEARKKRASPSTEAFIIIIIFVVCKRTSTTQKKPGEIHFAHILICSMKEYEKNPERFMEQN